MKIFYGGVIQGSNDRWRVHKQLIEAIKEEGHTVFTEHTSGETYEKRMDHLRNAIGELPEDEYERRCFVRGKMIEAIEGDIDAAVFEVSHPSLGTGIEIAHAYLRERLGLRPIPILALYEKGYWKNKLSTMIRGIDDCPELEVYDYEDVEDACTKIKEFLKV